MVFSWKGPLWSFWPIVALLSNISIPFDRNSVLKREHAKSTRLKKTAVKKRTCMLTVAQVLQIKDSHNANVSYNKTPQGTFNRVLWSFLSKALSLFLICNDLLLFVVTDGTTFWKHWLCWPWFNSHFAVLIYGFTVASLLSMVTDGTKHLSEHIHASNSNVIL